MSEARLKIPANAKDHIVGKIDWPLIVVEYGDFQCPHCREASRVMDQMVKEFSGRVALVYRHFPLRNLHPQAELAAWASEAADQQGKFWPMHAALFANQTDLTLGNILDLAGDLRLDVEKFKKDLDRDDLRQRVQADFSSGVRSGVNQTPTIFLNNERLDVRPTVNVLRNVLSGQQVEHGQ
jgi:protein-disulfide isomerase